MKNKLKLAIVSVIVQCILSLIVKRYPAIYFAGKGSVLIKILEPLCTLGVLPFFIALYKSEKFAAIMNENDKLSNAIDEKWIRHIIIRILIASGLCLLLFLVSLASQSGVGGAYVAAYGTAFILGGGALALIAEAVFLFVQRCYYKATGNILLTFIALCILLGMM